MKKNILFLSTILTTGLFSAQDTVSMGAGYANDNYYKLSSGVEHSVARNNWDIAFGAMGLGGAASTIRTNGSVGVDLFEYSNDINDWSSVDTTGFTWDADYNSEENWGVGAFDNRTLSGSTDLGWGEYNMITHITEANRVFIIKLANGQYKKIKIDQLTGGVYTFTYADLDGANEVTASIAKSNYSTRNFGYYSIENGVELDREPDFATWDLVFTKYITDLGMAYGVSGVLANNGRTVAQVDNVVDVNNVDYASATFEDDINIIGYDWKTFNMSTYQYDITDDVVFFVEDPVLDIYKLVFTGFGGSANGDFIFTKELVSSVGINETNTTKILNVYPNPATNFIQVIYKSINTSSSISVLDISGKTILNQVFSTNTGLNEERIDVSQLTAGVYFVKIQSGNSIATQKILIK